MPISKELIEVSKLPWFPNVMKELGYEPVRHGHWCVTQAYPHTIYCSECFQRFAQAHWAVWEDGSLPRDYCPHCGAKMDGERIEDAETKADRNGFIKQDDLFPQGR